MEAGLSSPVPQNYGENEHKERLDAVMENVEDNNPESLTPLPPALLLVSLPAMLVHPPTHPLHAMSLYLSLLALRRCLALENLTPDIECRAWASLAEIGMMVIAGNFQENEEHIWARGIDAEIETATSRGLQIAQKHPTLRGFRPHLTFLNAQLSRWQHNAKFARNLLRRLLSTFLPSDPPHAVYSAHLTYISHLMTPAPPPKNKANSPQTRPIQDIHAALTALSQLESESIRMEHRNVTILSHLIRLRLLVSSGLWDQAETALKAAEDSLQLDFPVPVADGSTSPVKRTEYIMFEGSAFERAMALHALIIGVVFYTYAGSDASSTARLNHLHALMDNGALKGLEDGIVEIPVGPLQPLHIRTTHSRILHVLAFLVSSVAKRDPAGRKPRRRLFATEGLAVWEKEMKKELTIPAWSSVSDMEEIDMRMKKMKADLYCELAGVAITRNEFSVAEDHLNELIAHCRNAQIFDSFSARITLHHAHLAHAQGMGERALTCYRVAAHIAGETGDRYVRVSSRAGEVALRIGQIRNSPAIGDLEHEWQEVKRMGYDVADACVGLGGTMESVGRIIRACLTQEILKAKNHLKLALEDATKSLDNHLRALIMALISSHFFHTAPEHALGMLGTCEQLGAGLGAASVKGEPDAVGNAPMRLWVGERVLEIHKRLGDSKKVKLQQKANKALGALLQNVAK